MMRQVFRPTTSFRKPVSSSPRGKPASGSVSSTRSFLSTRGTADGPIRRRSSTAAAVKTMRGLALSIALPAARPFLVKLEPDSVVVGNGVEILA